MTARRAAMVGVGAAMALSVAVVAGAAPTAAATPDQLFVAELTSARAASKLAVRQLKSTQPSPDGISKAKVSLALALKHLRAASGLLPQTVGGTQSEPVVTGLKTATAETSAAGASVRKRDYESARLLINEAIAASSATQASFGVPLAKDFSAKSVYRDFSNILGFEEFQGLTARVGAPIAKVVFGLAGRETANMGESRGVRGTPAIPITKLALYTLQEPSGSFTSNWCKLRNGIAVCDLDPKMEADWVFSVAFGPRVARGTQFLVKFWSLDGKKSHAIMTTR